MSSKPANEMVPAAQSANIMAWSTDDVPAPQRFDYWTNILSSSLTPMSLACGDLARFEASLAAAPMAALTAVEQHGSAHESHRSKRDIRQSLEQSYHLLVSLDCDWHIRHGHEQHLLKGDVLLANSELEYDIRIAKDYHFINLKMPSSWLRTWLPDPDALVGLRLEGDQPEVAALSGFISQLTPSFVTSGQLPRELLSDEVGMLLSVVAHRRGSTGVSKTSSALRAISECILERALQTGLTAAMVAEALGMTRQELLCELRAAGITFGQLLAAARRRVSGV